MASRFVAGFKKVVAIGFATTLVVGFVDSVMIDFNYFVHVIDLFIRSIIVELIYRSIGEAAKNFKYFIRSRGQSVIGFFTESVIKTICSFGTVVKGLAELS